VALKPAPPQPVGCIRRDVGIAMCGRSVGQSEFVFEADVYAVKNYEGAKGLSACAECCAAVRKKKPEQFAI
jgi:putative methionine-R-sulfoxide reductase with GAF domain